MYEAARTLIYLLSFLFFRFCSSIDIITPKRSIKDGDVLVSSGTAAFALGFFGLGNSSSRYVGIWYNKVPEQTVVWVANRDSPITTPSGILSIDQTGNLALHDPNKTFPLWSTNVPNVAMANSSGFARLLDSGNLVLYRGDVKKVVIAWQSFDYPSNTFLPNMRLGVDRRAGLNRFLTSWRSQENPGTGDYSFKMDMDGLPQFFLSRGPDRLWRSGPWNGFGWSGVPEMRTNFIFNVSFVENQDEVYVEYTIRDPSIFSRLVVNESGLVERLTWHGDNANGKWVAFWSTPKDKCEYFGQCGSYSDCDPYKPSEFECKCLPGFEPRSARDWYLRDGSKGCSRKKGRNSCRNREGFIKLARVKVPDTSTALVDTSLGLKACEDSCLKNCSCRGYTSADISKGETGCITWYGDLIDTRQFSDKGQDIYVRVDAVELAEYSKNSQNSHHKRLVIIVAVSIAAVVLILSLATFCLKVKLKGKREESKLLSNFNNSPSPYDNSSRDEEFVGRGTNSDLQFFDLRTIVDATDNFSHANKLGEGGFGSVYKGRLSDGQEVAVKRLSKSSGQGIEEFKNEVSLIARLQHRNLVRLLGSCVVQQEKILVYEYLPNKSLDSYIFDKEKSSLLDWRKRFEIVLGIARGIIYLHHDSRLRIIHRDLKASNVLLDTVMDPKISDFGMARIFGGDQIQANTNRVVGTYGYMSPEYAMEGQFSTKSDVFSFGVLLMEIISGRKNNSYYKENSVNLIGHVWELWKEGRTLDVVDPSVGESYQPHEVVRCIHIGLLCVQESASDRPTMSEVAFMLCNETTLPSPNQPAFIFRQANTAQYSSSASIGANSVNDATITVIEAR